MILPGRSVTGLLVPESTDPGPLKLAECSQCWKNQELTVQEVGTDGPGSVGPRTDGPGSVGPGSVGSGTEGPGSVGQGSVGAGSVGPVNESPGSVGPGSVGP